MSLLPGGTQTFFAGNFGGGNTEVARTYTKQGIVQRDAEADQEQSPTHHARPGCILKLAAAVGLLHLAGENCTVAQQHLRREHHQSSDAHHQGGKDQYKPGPAVRDEQQDDTESSDAQETGAGTRAQQDEERDREWWEP